MTAQKDIEFLRNYNRWRRGDDLPMPDPKEIGEVIDRVCGYLEDVLLERNPYHKPAGTHKPVVDPPPVHTLSRQDKFKLMFGQCLANSAKK